MRKTFAAAVVGALLAGGALTLAAAPASASEGSGWLCMTRDATPVYANQNFTGYLFTLSPGRGFRAHQYFGVDATVVGFYGHGAERPDRDGYVRAQHIYGC